MEDAAFALLACLIVVGVDWALIDGFRASLVAFRDLPKAYNYRKFLFPRIFLILLSGLTIYIGSQTDAFGEQRDVAIFFAIALFFITSLYPQVVMFLRSKSYERP